MDSISNFFEKIGVGGVLGSAILLFLGWLFGKGKINAEIFKAKADAKKTTTEQFIALDAYQEKKIAELIVRAEKQDSEIAKLKEEISAVTKENKEMKREINMLKNYRTLKH